jgi:hypothetical protein
MIAPCPPPEMGEGGNILVPCPPPEMGEEEEVMTAMLLLAPGSTHP